MAGQTGRHPVTGEVGRDIREQTRNTLERIKVVLAAAGTSLDNVLSAMTHLTRREDLAAYNEEYAKYFPTDKPARTTVTVASLNAPELLVEITVIAVHPRLTVYRSRRGVQARPVRRARSTRTITATSPLPPPSAQAARTPRRSAMRPIRSDPNGVMPALASA